MVDFQKISDSEVTVADAVTELPGRVIATVSKKTRQSSAICGVGNGHRLLN